MSETELTLQQIRERLKKEAARPASERFRELVAAGIVDKEGRFQRRNDGEAPSPENPKHPK